MARHAEKAFAVEDQDTAELLGDEEAPRIVARVRDRGCTRDTKKNPTASRLQVNGNRFAPNGLRPVAEQARGAGRTLTG